MEDILILLVILSVSIVNEGSVIVSFDRLGSEYFRSTAIIEVGLVAMIVVNVEHAALMSTVTFLLFSKIVFAFFTFAQLSALDPTLETFTVFLLTIRLLAVASSEMTCVVLFFDDVSFMTFLNLWLEGKWVPNQDLFL